MKKIFKLVSVLTLLIAILVGLNVTAHADYKAESIGLISNGVTRGTPFYYFVFDDGTSCWVDYEIPAVITKEINSTCSLVPVIQHALTDLNYRSISHGGTLRCDPQGIDGAYGYNTASAVANFQAWAGISPDGETGRNTWDKLDYHHAYYYGYLA